MQKKVGSIDREIRALVGVALLAAFFLGAIKGTLGIVGLVVGVVMLGTAAIGWCPPYSLLGINTCGVKQKAQNA
jgi:quinol-cytochrome oxidoreductase complex cytochrome b subunit